MSTAEPQASYRLQTVSRALETIRLLEQTRDPLSQKEIAETLGEPVPVVFRILRTLEGHGFVSRRPDKRYLPRGTTERKAMGVPLDIMKHLAAAGPGGLSLPELAMRTGAEPAHLAEALSALASRQLATETETGTWALGFGLLEVARPLLRNTLRATVRPLMEKLRDESGETATLFVSSGNQQVVVDVAVSREPLRYELEIGRAFDLHRGAAGKAAMAAMDDAGIADVLDGAGVAGDDRRRVLADIARARKAGFATSSGERIEGASAVAAAVRDESGRPRGVMGLMMPSFRNPPDRLAHLGRVLANQLTQLRLPDEMPSNAQPTAGGDGI
ncbi:MAG: helix-turn-helix domain-containing protein [Alphaproteobacteria bacterium]|nr:helix-turn-helix domain-containing protein [Alphaproteobacteria bacterium]